MRLRESQLGLLLISLIFIFSAVLQSTVPVNAEAQNCPPVVMYLLQGSGQNNVNSNEMNSLKEEVARRVASVEYVTLSYPIEYPSVLINPLDDAATPDTKWIAAEAIATGGGWGVYTDSVNLGASSLNNKISDLTQRCRDTKIVLAGYSQGADAVGKALSVAHAEVINKISYVALFGDPEANMYPIDGLNPFDVPWKRGSTLLWSDGILGGRKPYVNSLLKYSLGSWCDYLDGICKGNLLTMSSGAHSKYADKYTSAAAKEIADKILKNNPELRVSEPACGANKQDIVLAINMSAAVRSDRYFLGDAGIQKTVDGVLDSACDVRVGLVTFGEDGIDPVQPVLDFTADKAELTDALKTFRTGFEPTDIINKVDITDGISMAMDYSWRSDAGKAVIVLSDAPGNNYKELQGKIDMDQLMKSPDIQDILRKSREKGGVEVHSLQILHSSRQSYQYMPSTISFYNYMDRLTPLTAGTFKWMSNCNNCWWGDMKFDFKDQFAREPTVSVPSVRIKLGESIELAAKDISAGLIENMSKPPNYPVSYAWFTDCDHLGRGTLQGQTVTFTPTKAGACDGSVLVRGNSWGWCNTCPESDMTSPRSVTPFRIEVLPADYVDPPVPGVIRNVQKERLWDNDAIRISWDAPENVAEVGQLAYIIKDADGNVIGATTATRLHITEVADDDDPIILVSAASQNGTGASYSSKDARDITPPPETDTTAQIEQAYGITTAQSISAPGNTGQAISIQSSRVQTPVLGTQIAKQIFSPTARTDIVSANSKPNVWTTLTIIAMPLIAAIALGFAVKNGMILKFRK